MTRAGVEYLSANRTDAVNRLRLLLDQSAQNRSDCVQVVPTHLSQRNRRHSMRLVEPRADKPSIAIPRPCHQHTLIHGRHPPTSGQGGHDLAGKGPQDNQILQRDQRVALAAEGGGHCSRQRERTLQE